MAGKVTKNVMYTPMRVVRLMPDFRMFRMWYKTCRATSATTRSCWPSSPSSSATG